MIDLSVENKVAGVSLAAVEAGIKYPDKTDLLVVKLDPATVTAATFTTNRFCAAPVSVAKAHLHTVAPRALVINTGFANAGTGEQGLANAKNSCSDLSKLLNCRAEEILPFSTGVIGENLPYARLFKGMQQAVQNIDGASQTNLKLAAEAIMTTDTRPKFASVTADINGSKINISGISKGAGMIEPNMATMLSFVFTDAKVEAPDLRECLKTSVKKSFNCITVDGDTSTNDACTLSATGSSGVVINTAQKKQLFQNALDELMVFLAQAIIRDAEGATKFVEIRVTGGSSEAASKAVAYTVARSPLVKTALFASDPNWGRILAAIGRAPIADLVIEDVDIGIGDVIIVKNGQQVKDYEEAAAAKVMAKKEITISISLGKNDTPVEIWTSDLSYDYVKINAEYRT